MRERTEGGNARHLSREMVVVGGREGLILIYILI
jgi:hypothetical protein